MHRIRYQFTYFQSYDDEQVSFCQESEFQFNSTQTNLNHRIRDLTPFTNYTITISAATVVGLGDPASALNETYQDGNIFCTCVCIMSKSIVSFRK